MPELPARLQDLPPRLARLCLSAEAFALSQAGQSLRGSRILAAYSGGLDSTALLLVLKYLSPRLEIKLEAAHLDHGLRQESGAEAGTAVSFCRSIGVKCHLGLADVSARASQAKTGIEDAARQARYEFLERTRTHCQADFIAVAHQLNDLAEDQLMRLTRGTGWPGLGGMEACDPGRKLVRPLLLTPRQDLRELLETLNVSWSEDPSNQDLTRKRNRVRHRLLPDFIEENPDYLGAAARLWRLARLEEAYWDKLLEPLRQTCTREENSVLLEREILSRLDPALRLRLYKWALDELGPGQAQNAKLFELEEIVSQGAVGKEIQFPGRKCARLTRETLTFSSKAQGEPEIGEWD